MKSSFRSLLSVALAYGADAARISRHAKHQGDKNAKFIAGTPILNYNLAFGGASAAGAEEDWIVVVEKGTTSDQIHALCQGSAKCLREGHPDTGGVPFFEMRGTEQELEAVLKAAGGAVKFVEPDLEMHLIPDIEEATTESVPWGLQRVGAPLRANEGAGVHVYVLDTGIRATHSDFGGRVVPTLDMSIGDGKECGGDLSCAGDVRGHGTHCAGTAAGASFGVAPQAALHSVKVLSDAGSGSWSWSYSALDFLATKGARPAVASMSLGGKGIQNAMQAAMDAAVGAGVVVVVAAGNDNSNACGFSPAFVPSAITVGSTTSTDARSSFSNYGACVDIWAPGSAIVSAGVSDDTSASTKSGTSMACPHVSGAAALWLENSPSASSEQVLAGLLGGAINNGISDLWEGDTNSLLYVGAGGPPATPVPGPTPPPHPALCPWEFSSGPDRDGDCACFSGFSCFQGGQPGCQYSYSGPNKTTSWRYFVPGCADCECRKQ